MEYSCKLGAAEKMRAACLVVGVHENSHLTPLGSDLDKALGGLFLYLAEEEAAIRKNPAKQTTQLLKKLFGKGN